MDPIETLNNKMDALTNKVDQLIIKVEKHLTVHETKDKLKIAGLNTMRLIHSAITIYLLVTKLLK